jgi:hypothetical protein
MLIKFFTLNSRWSMMVYSSLLLIGQEGDKAMFQAAIEQSGAPSPIMQK